MTFDEYWKLYWLSESLSGEMGRLVKTVAKHAWKHAVAETDHSERVAYNQNVMDAYEITERTAL